MAQDQPLLAGGRDPEPALGDLAVGPADADLDRPDEHLRRLRARVGLGTTATRRAGPAGRGTSACISRGTSPSTRAVRGGADQAR